MIDLGIRCSEVGCAIPTIFHNFWWIVLILLSISGIIYFKRKCRKEGKGEKQ